MFPSRVWRAHLRARGASQSAETLRSAAQRGGRVGRQNRTQTSRPEGKGLTDCGIKPRSMGARGGADGIRGGPDGSAQAQLSPGATRGWRFRPLCQRPWAHTRARSVGGLNRLCSNRACRFGRVRHRDSMVCSPPGSSVHGILQASILDWVAISSSRGSSRPRDQTTVSYISCTGRWILYHKRHARKPTADSKFLDHNLGKLLAV